MYGSQGAVQSTINGLYDALTDTGGDVIAVAKREAREASKLFLQTEGCNICPELGVALASLIKKNNGGKISKDAIVMLNITGGGMAGLKANPRVKPVGCDLRVDRSDFNIDKVAEKISSLFNI
jgi:cysteate synthase